MVMRNGMLGEAEVTGVQFVLKGDQSRAIDAQ